MIKNITRFRPGIYGIWILDFQGASRPSILLQKFKRLNDAFQVAIFSM